MQEELSQLARHEEWHLVPRPQDSNVMGTKWIFKNKSDENGNITRNKARLVAQGYTWVEGIDFEETFSLVARLESIRLLMAFACTLCFKLYQIDVKISFLNGYLNEEVFVVQPKGFEDPSVDPQFRPSTLTFYPMDVTLTHRSHMAPLGPHLTLVGFRASSGLVYGPLSAYVVHFGVSSWEFFFLLLASCHRKQVGPPKVLAQSKFIRVCQIQST